VTNNWLARLIQGNLADTQSGMSNNKHWFIAKDVQLKDNRLLSKSARKSLCFARA